MAMAQGGHTGRVGEGQGKLMTSASHVTSCLTDRQGARLVCVWGTFRLFVRLHM